MPSTPSPLRYPGGKHSILPMVSELIKANKLDRGHYAEPYAGGCGLALGLLFKGHVHEIHLNDLDRSVWAFWEAIVNNADQFINEIETTPITMEEWSRQRDIQLSASSNDFQKAFSAFFLNRTNRSGVICKAGVIGGFKQDGKYKLDCRFNKNGLIEKIRRIEKYKHRIHIYNDDAIDFIKTIDESLPSKSFICIDPPYYNKGSTLYTNFYNTEDHKALAQVILGIKKPWILTYDDATEIQNIYKSRRQFRFNLNYSAAKKRVGTELLIASPHLRIPGLLKAEKLSA
ncbi:DNA adenine methylase [Pseudomonas amygdali]|uniref:DNA adenine methylase n=1 Tax=Pseudomonas amygdali TaxID=47877 RepID=UPI000E3DB667|nr:DNA adenine methylase [Pseudomonas amygdali]